jgi:predicted AlkP superfamily phosphohydrolase/phosphomutase
MSGPNYRVLVLGLDGATFDLMQPWVAQGHLPNLGKLLSDGACSPLESTIPPITPCAWSSFMTGKNPGKHGLFDFVEPLADHRGFRFTNACSRHGETLWGYLSRNGRRVGVMNVPMTYPPEPVQDGYLISGLDTPNEQSDYTYPKSLRDELAAQGIHYRIDVQHLGNMRTDRRRDLRLKELCDVETVRTQALLHLQRRYPVDFNMLVYTATDQVQHHFWHYMHSRHDKYDPRGAERYRNAIRDVYVHVDQLIGSVLNEIDDRTVVIVMSDHGFGPTTDVRVRLNQALAENGLLSFDSEGVPGRTLRTLAGKLDGILRSTLSNGAKRLLAGAFPRLRVWFEALDEARIDWSKTSAYTNEAYRSSPAVWLNRRTSAQIDRASATRSLDELLELTEKVLRALTVPETGRPAISHVYRTRDLYHGPYMDKAPDLIPSWWEDGFLLEQSMPGMQPGQAVERSREPIKGGVEFAGSHRLHGVFAMAGGPVRKGYAFTGAHITDVAPTVLYLMGLPIPGDMDGKPLLGALDPSFTASQPLHYEKNGSHPATHAPPASETVFSEEEALLIEERLKSMGYIE